DLCGYNDRFGRSRVEPSGEVRSRRLLIISQVLPAELPNEPMVPAVPGPAFRHKIAILEQLHSVLLQEPLDRACAGFVRANVDVANALCHLRTLVPKARCGQFLSRGRFPKADIGVTNNAENSAPSRTGRILAMCEMTASAGGARCGRSRIYTLETNPLRCATSFQGASTARAGSCNISSARAFIALIARRSRRAVNQPGRRTSKSLGVNSAATSAAKISDHGLPQTD